MRRVSALALALSCVLACAAVDAQGPPPPHLEWGGLSVIERGDPRADAALVLLHGYGAPGDDLVSLADEVATRSGRALRIVLPAAPIVMPHGGRAWWAIRGDDEAAQISSARAALRGVLVTLERRGVAAERVVVGGFSQGAILSIELAYDARAPRVAGIAVLSGRAIDHARGDDERLRGLAIFQSHGRGDDRIPFARGEAFRARAERAGARLEHVEFDGGHAIPPSVSRALATWLLATLPSRARP